MVAVGPQIGDHAHRAGGGGAALGLEQLADNLLRLATKEDHALYVPAPVSHGRGLNLQIVTENRAR